MWRILMMKILGNNNDNDKAHDGGIGFDDRENKENAD